MGRGYKGDLKYFTSYSETGMRVRLTRPTKDHKKVTLSRKKLFYSYLDLYDNYVEVCNKNDLEPLSKEDYRKFLDHYFEGVLHLVNYHNVVFILPYGLGRFYLNKSHRVGLSGGEVYRNFHTFQRHFYMKWDKESGYFRNRTMWRWSNSTKSRKYTNQVAQSLPSPWNDEYGIRKGPIGHNFRGSSKWN